MTRNHLSGAIVNPGVVAGMPRLQSLTLTLVADAVMDEFVERL